MSGMTGMKKWGEGVNTRGIANQHHAVDAILLVSVIQMCVLIGGVVTENLHISYTRCAIHEIPTTAVLLVGTNRRFIFGFDFVSFSPLPVVVAVVVDLFDRDRGLRGDVVRKIVRPLVDLVVI